MRMTPKEKSIKAKEQNAPSNLCNIQSKENMVVVELMQ